MYPSEPRSDEPKKHLPELFLVEGESAGLAVQRVCNQDFQQVITMQGKPMNAWKASAEKVSANPLYRAVVDALGTGVGNAFQLSACKFSKVILLFDPDADGIHCSALMLWFFHRWMPDLLSSGRILVAMPPLCELRNLDTNQTAYPTHPKEIDQILQTWTDARVAPVDRTFALDATIPSDKTVQREAWTTKKVFRGLASMGSEVLLCNCIDPATRTLRRARPEDAIASLEAFAGREFRA
jgi:DNA gyrase subunit B